MKDNMQKWTIENSKSLYNIDAWSNEYFDINQDGNIVAKLGSNKSEVDLKIIIDKLNLNDTATPVLLRFPDILEASIVRISEAFAEASKEYNYSAKYFTVYPIKVNQMRPVVEEIVRSGSRFNIGLEAGSKPELHAVLASTEDEDSLIICNGYKDQEYLELALLAQKTGKNIFIVVEKLNELRQIISLSQKLKLKPNIGIRIKLTSSGSGKWAESGGDNSKFGLNSSELLEAVKLAKDNNILDCIRMLHFHIGSQITQIRKIKTALREAARYYVELRNLGCGIDHFDIGGGLGVDYDGSQSSNYSSINYTVQEYAKDTVFAISDVCNKFDLPCPNIITESGRALSAYHSVLIFDVLEKMSLPVFAKDENALDTSNELIKELADIWSELSPENMREHWHDANQIREESNNLFSLGHLNLNDRAVIDKYYWSINKQILKFDKDNVFESSEIERIRKNVADKYFCNFSLFQSLPDSWAIDQLFPIMPIHRLDEKPEVEVTLQDITCDSDGKINQFVTGNKISSSLPLHEFRDGEKYYLAVFLIGAYQEILGDLHNLFGDTNVAHIGIKDGEAEILSVIDGETINEVLSYVGFDAKTLVKKMERWVGKSIKSDKISQAEGKEFLANYRSGLYGYTYLET